MQFGELKQLTINSDDIERGIERGIIAWFRENAEYGAVFKVVQDYLLTHGIVLYKPSMAPWSVDWNDNKHRRIFETSIQAVDFAFKLIDGETGEEFIDELEVKRAQWTVEDES